MSRVSTPPYKLCWPDLPMDEQGRMPAFRYMFAGCYLAGLKWDGRGWRMHFLDPRFWDEGTFRRCACAPH